uniref:START domain-containing protein n=1 Tax=Heterorhabditis bacteriophora TaxID=37862 RepID=A0A1I7W7S7_HETBA
MNMAEILIIRSEVAHISLDEVKGRFKDRYIFQDSHGLIRYQSRMLRSDLGYHVKNPIFVPKISKVSPLIVEETHVTNGQCVTKWTMAYDTA